jgi:hypothetical protein
MFMLGWNKPLLGDQSFAGPTTMRDIAHRLG